MDFGTDTPRKHDDPDTAQPVEDLVEKDNKYTDTECMTGYRMEFWEDQGYIQALAKHLFDSICISWLFADQETRTRITAIVPRLLKGFASRLRYDTDYLIHQDIITFIDNHSWYVT